MAHVRCSHNHSRYVLSNNGVEFGTSIVGNSILIEREIDQVYKPFGGFIEVQSEDHIHNLQTLKVVNVKAFTLDDVGLSDWIDQPSDQPVLAYNINGKCVLPIIDGRLVTYKEDHHSFENSVFRRVNYA